MLDLLPPDVLGAVLAQLPAGDVVYGAARHTSRYLRACCLAYMASSTELVVRPGLWPAGAGAAASAARLRSLIIETPGAASDAADSVLGALLPLNAATRVAFRCGSISLSTLRLLREGCPAMTTMTMASASLSDAHLELLSGFHELRVLDVSGNARLTDAGVRHLSRGCAQLRVLDLSGCARISDGAMEMLTDHCPLRRSSSSSRAFEHLETLDVRETDVSESGVALVRERCPHIEQLVVDDAALCSDLHKAFVANTIAWQHQAA